MNRFLLLIVAAATAICVSSSKGCHIGWREFRGHCYAFNEQKVSWLTAADTCQVYGGRLVEIDNKGKNVWLLSQVIRNKDNYWIGATSSLNGKNFEWISSRKPLKYQDWISGEPNNFGGRENCVEMRKIYNYRWNDIVCETKNGFICEKRL